MKEKTSTLKIYNFSHPLMLSELLSLSGDKYAKVLSFEWELVDEIASAQIVVWDGVVTPRNQSSVARMLELLRDGKVLLLLGESKTIFRDHPLVRSLDLTNLRTVEVPSWNALPEEILSSFEHCREMLAHV